MTQWLGARGCSSGGPIRGYTIPPATPVQGNLPSSSGFHRHCTHVVHRHACRPNTCVHSIKQNGKIVLEIYISKSTHDQVYPDLWKIYWTQKEHRQARVPQHPEWRKPLSLIHKTTLKCFSLNFQWYFIDSRRTDCHYSVMVNLPELANTVLCNPVWVWECLLLRSWVL